MHPLDQLTKEAKAANRAPHLRKKHIHGSDSIDKLDQASLLGAYHHEGPYDAASLARNNSWTNAPVAALAETTREALRATPRENIQDSIERHRPLDGVSSIPPGEKDRFGRTYHYREGAEEDVMRAVNAGGGAYKRYTDIVCGLYVFVQCDTFADCTRTTFPKISRAKASRRTPSRSSSRITSGTPRPARATPWSSWSVRAAQSANMMKPVMVRRPSLGRTCRRKERAAAQRRRTTPTASGGDHTGKRAAPEASTG